MTNESNLREALISLVEVQPLHRDAPSYTHAVKMAEATRPAAPAPAPADFPPRIHDLLREIADRKGTAQRGLWEDGNGEPLQDDADAALAWISAASAPQPVAPGAGDAQAGPSDATPDQLIELTAHLERVRARVIIEAVEKIGADIDPDCLGSHWCGWASALEEVKHRIKTEAWGMLPNGGWGPTGAANEDDRLSPEFPDLLRRALAATPPSVSGIGEAAEPVAYLTRSEEGDAAMLFFDIGEARTYCEEGQEPEPLFLARLAAAQQEGQTA